MRIDGLDHLPHCRFVRYSSNRAIGLTGISRRYNSYSLVRTKFIIQAAISSYFGIERYFFRGILAILAKVENEGG